MVCIPNEWFFFNPYVKSNYKILKKISRKTGIVFFKNNNTNPQSEFFFTIKPYIDWCRKKRIKFILPSSLYWANKYKAFGIFVDNKKRKLNFSINLKTIKKKYFIATKVHNIFEGLNSSDCDFIFISPVFKTNSFPKKKPLSRYFFLSLCLLMKKKKIFALGGVNKLNYKKLKNKNIHGFGGISNFNYFGISNDI